MAADAVPVPPQVKLPEIYDFRNSSTAPKGFKERRKRKLEQVQCSQPSHMLLLLHASKGAHWRRGGTNGHRHTTQAELDSEQAPMQEEPSDSQPAKRKKLQATRVRHGCSVSLWNASHCHALQHALQHQAGKK